LFEEKVALARRLLNDYGRWNWDHRLVFWSGGKDSTVVLHLALNEWNGDFIPVFVDTGITIPETIRYVKRISKLWNLRLKIIKPKIDFWNEVIKCGFPHHKALWCRSKLKMQPIRSFLDRLIGWKLQVLGIRAKESIIRRDSWFYKKPFMRSDIFNFTYELNPILDWTKRDVLRYLCENEIPQNEAWRLYHTSGCYFCPFVRNTTHYLTLKRLHPELFRKIVDAERKMGKRKQALPTKSLFPLEWQKLLSDFRGEQP